jgi:hypothetical protein
MNAETLRDVLKDKDQWNGSASLNFNLAKNTKNIFNINTRVGAGYNDGANLWMIISNLNFTKIEGEEFANSGSQHFRYNRKISDKTKLEVFAQGQYDQISKIKFRGLVGLGPRFKLSKDYEDDEDNKPRIYLGTLIMYEYEKSSEADASLIHKDIRSSNYLSFTLPFNGIKIISTTYFQPKINLLKDYRVFSDLSVDIKFPKKETDENTEDEPKSFWEKLSFNISFSYNYDAFPVSTIPKTQYSLTNGIRYDFN